MEFFFVQDHKQKYRFFTAEPIHQIQVEFSRLKKIWELAKQKLMLLPKRTLVQEQAFEAIINLKERTHILYSGSLSEKKIKKKFHFFLQKQRTKHIALLIGEAILLPISGLMALLPGPNVFFGVLALIMYTHWQSLRGINRFSKLQCTFKSSSLFQEWEKALLSEKDEDIIQALDKIQSEFNLRNIHKILWK